MVVVTNKELLEQLGEIPEGEEWIADIDSPDATLIASAIKGTLRNYTEKDGTHNGEYAPGQQDLRVKIIGGANG
jgi:hypothetical protein